MFQSPLRRGTDCGSGSYATSAAIQCCFNPLFDGEQTAGMTTPVQSCHVCTFQSPLRRGTDCGYRLPSSLSFPSVGFQSPLRRGTDCGEELTTDEDILGCRFQSPLRRGTDCGSCPRRGSQVGP